MGYTDWTAVQSCFDEPLQIGFYPHKNAVLKYIHYAVHAHTTITRTTTATSVMPTATMPTSATIVDEARKTLEKLPHGMREECLECLEVEILKNNVGWNKGIQ